MTDQHTPGPWTVQHTTNAEGYPITVVDGADEATVCILDEQYDIPAEANARLIAAAPSMLEALEWLLENAEIDALNEPELVPAVEAARSAIAAARGFADYESYNLSQVEA